MCLKKISLGWRAPAGAIALAGALLFAGQTPALAAEVSGKLGLVTADDSINGRISNFYSSLVDVRSEGRIDIKVFPAGQLGKAKTQMEGMIAGTHDLFMHISMYTGHFPEVQFWDLPFLFNDTTHVSRTVMSPIRGDLEKAFDCQGMVYLGTVGYGFRAFTSRGKAIAVPGDLKGVKHRIPGGKAKAALFEILGANPATIEFPELYQALNAGVVDSQDNPLSTIYTSKFHEVTDYMSMLNYVYNPNILAASKMWWEKLDPADQDLLVEAAFDTEAWSQLLADNDDMVYLNKIMAERPDYKVNTMKPEDLALWKEKAKPVYDFFIESAGKPWSDAVFTLVDGGYWKSPGMENIPSCKGKSS